MKASRFELDPNGDVELILETQLPPDFVWTPDKLCLGTSASQQRSYQRRRTKSLSAADDHTDDQSEWVRMRVSSRHLILASPVFRMMLEGPWLEAAVPEPGLREIRVGSWHLEALIIVLDAIHGHHRSILTSLSLDMIAKVAIIVDYYQCKEIIEVFVHLWINTLKKDVPKSYGKESTL